MNKRILLGVTGGIAAYKSAELIRRLQDQGAVVRVVMTKAAQEFITPLTLQALSGMPVHTDLLDTEAEAAMGHIELARWADLVLIAPASADFIAKLVHGEGSDLLSTLCLATNSQLAVVPAMNQGMWANPATQKNIESVKDRAIHMFGPASGSQACGDVGLGRMLEPMDIVDHAAGLFQNGALSGKRVVITAGPTREAIDPVRYISNHSSGKMGYALAEACVEAGAQTILISGPVALGQPERVEFISVESAEQMHINALAKAEDANIFIAAAAVADYRPVRPSEQKIKKTDSDTMSIELVKTPDVLASVAAEYQNLFTVGFAAETQGLTKYATDKLNRKKLDMVVANNVATPGIGFNSDNNSVTVVQPDSVQEFSERSKTQLARDLVALIAERINIQ